MTMAPAFGPGGRRFHGPCSFRIGGTGLLLVTWCSRQGIDPGTWAGEAIGRSLPDCVRLRAVWGRPRRILADRYSGRLGARAIGGCELAGDGPVTVADKDRS